MSAWEYVEQLCEQLDRDSDRFIIPCFRDDDPTKTLNEWQRRFSRRMANERNDHSIRAIQQILQERVVEVQQLGGVQLEICNEGIPSVIFPRVTAQSSRPAVHVQVNAVISGVKELQPRVSQSNSLSDKPKDLEHVPHSAPVTPTLMFHGIRAFFVRLGTLSKARIVALREKIVQKGGQVEDIFSESVTHVITGKNVSYDKIQRACSSGGVYPIQSLAASLDAVNSINQDLVLHLDNSVHVHTAEWISESLINGAISDEYSHRILPTIDHINTQTQKESSQIDTEAQEIKSISPLKPVDSAQKPKYKWESRFACQKLPGEETICVNQAIVDELNQMLTIYKQTGNQWRTVAYNKAIAAIKRYPKKIESGEEAKKIFGVGNGIGDKIHEMINTGKITKLESLQENKKIQCIQIFSKIWGVGTNTAETWYSQGLRTLDDVRKKAKLNHSQTIGLTYYEDFQKRIPRSEVEEISRVVSTVALQIRSSLEIVPCGSYRRGKLDSGDVDILITDRTDDVDFDLSEVLPAIRKYLCAHDSNFNRVFSDDGTQVGSGYPFIVASLSTQRREDSGECSSFMGVCKLAGYDFARRIDIKVYHPGHFPFALLYFTGSDHFNRSMRLLAHKKGLSLSDKSLRHVVRNNRVKVHEGKEIPCNTEQEIFTALNLEYREPHERDI